MRNLRIWLAFLNNEYGLLFNFIIFHMVFAAFLKKIAKHLSKLKVLIKYNDL